MGYYFTDRINPFHSVRTKLLASLVLVIGAAFYLVAFSTVRLVGDALFSDAIRSHAAQTQNLAAALGEKLGSDTADVHQRLLQAASQAAAAFGCGRGWKVTYDTFGERCGTLLALGEVRSVLRGERMRITASTCGTARANTGAVRAERADRARYFARGSAASCRRWRRTDSEPAAAAADGRAGDGGFADLRARPHGVHLFAGADGGAGAGGADLPHRDPAGRGAFRRHRADEQGRL
ncbi:MAG: hypothetical protein ACLUI3_02785 [Christensenellales bacterium]